MEGIFFNGVRYSIPHKASCMAHYQLTLMSDLEDSRITLNRKKKRKRYKKFWWSEQFDETGENSLSTEVRLAISINVHVTEIITQQNIHKYTHSLLSFSLSHTRTHHKAACTIYFVLPLIPVYAVSKLNIPRQLQIPVRFTKGKSSCVRKVCE